MSRSAGIGVACALAVLAGCGRTGLPDDAADAGDAGALSAGDGGPTDGGRTDGGVSDGGVGDGGLEAPLLIVVARNNGCPTLGADADLLPAAPATQLQTVRVTALDECTGAGGDWLVSQSVANAARLFLLGGHACYYVPRSLYGSTAMASFFGVVRFTPNTPTSSGPTSACVASPSGVEPVVTHDTVAAVALFRTQAGAEAARARWAR